MASDLKDRIAETHAYASRGGVRVDPKAIEVFAPFADLSRDEAAKLLALASVRRVSEHGTFFHDGDAADHVFLLIQGFVRIQHVTPSGDQVVVLHLSPGEIFGISKLVETASYRATAKAASDAVALAWPAESWDHIVARYPGLLRAGRRAVASRLSEMQIKIVEMATQPVKQRIARAVLRLVDNAGRRTPQGIEVGFPITRQDISDLTGTTMHSVSRFMSGWDKDGIIMSKRRRIVVCNTDGLRRVASGEAA